jgi:predicted phosphodiesterase
MRIALISDIHSNLPALEAVLEDIERRQDIDAVYHIGDLVGYAPWPNEVVGIIQDEGIVGVSGNYDSTVANDYAHCGCKYEDDEQERLSHISFEWTKAHVTPQARAFLKRLPFRLDIKPNGGHASGPKLILVHGTPTLNTLYWTADRDDEFSLQMAAMAGAKAGDVIAFGHTHIPWTNNINGIEFVNTGSVGRPKDGNWRAGYSVIGFEKPVYVEHHRVEYDIEKTMHAIRDSDLPDEFADYLKNGGAAKT